MEDWSKVFTLGDPINVYDGDTQIDGTGSFIEIRDRVLVWTDSSGNVRFQVLGDAINFFKPLPSTTAT
jgi:uncharacterized protein YxjI